jgi:hypothetical protein
LPLRRLVNRALLGTSSSKAAVRTMRIAREENKSGDSHFGFIFVTSPVVVPILIRRVLVTS